MRPVARWSVSFVLSITIASGCADAPESPMGPGAPTSGAEAACEPFMSDASLMVLVGAMQAEVEALESGGTINAGQARALMRHLTNAERQAERNEFCAARDQLVAFREQLEDLVGEGAISDREAYDLRHAARLALAGEVIQPGDPEEYAPGVTGEPRTVSFQGEELRVVEIDGLAIFNGDVILGFMDELSGTPEGDQIARSGPCRGCTKWTGTIRFSYADDWGAESTNAVMRQRVVRAINHWREKTGFEFDEDLSSPDIVFRNSMGCSSPVGRRVITGLDKHYINISTGCGFGAVVHEIGHTIGLWHEQSRSDRNDFVMVTLDAVREGREFNFEQYGSAGTDLGPYDYGSIMHYGCDDFKDASATVDPIQPLQPGVTCADVAQRDSLSTRDRAGAYFLDEVEYEIVREPASGPADRLLLSLDWTSEPVPPSFITWDVEGRGSVGTGHTLDTGPLVLEDGRYTARAYLIIAGMRLLGRSIEFDIVNQAPTVDLGVDRDVDLNRSFTVFADVTDAEDGSCPPSECTYEWSPAPQSDLGGAAVYFFDEEGPQSISVTVTDGAGASASDDLVVNVVDSPPTVVIETPPNGSTFNAGSSVGIRGSATDPNVGPGPDPGVVPCFPSLYDWSSSDPSDVIDLTDGCSGTLTLGDPGPRTLTLEVEQDGGIGSASITLYVEACGAGGCAPDVSFDFDTPPQLDGSLYDPAFTGPGYLIDTELQATGLISDPDTPATTITYEWTVRPPCVGGCDPFVVASGSLLPPNNAFLSWTPSADPRVIDYWPTCTTTALPFVISLVATDTGGNTRTYSRTVYLACDLI